MILALALACTTDEPSAETGILGLCEDCAEACVEEFQVPGAAAHVTGDVIFEDPPPSSGDHDGCWSRWGVHEEPVPDERWVHNLEHGGIVFLYSCPEGCAEEVAALADLTTELGDFALLTPYDALPSRFAAVAWGWRYVTDCFDRADFEGFYQRHVDRAPESIAADPGASCP